MRYLRSLTESQNGFTLIEAIVVVTIIGILSYVAIANFEGSHSRLQYESATKKLAADVRYAREMAFSRKVGTHVYVDESSNRYYLKWETGEYLENPIGGGNFIIQLGSGDFFGVKVTGTGFSGGRLDFTTAGLPLNSGSSFNGTLILATINNKKKITLNATGLLKIEDL